jgi:hypothetical protein
MHCYSLQIQMGLKNKTKQKNQRRFVTVHCEPVFRHLGLACRELLLQTVAGKRPVPLRNPVKSRVLPCCLGIPSLQSANTRLITEINLLKSQIICDYLAKLGTDLID